MRVIVNQSILELIEGDITLEETDAIVNAANSALSGGGGVDGAIHRVGGPSIMEECRRIGECPRGEARITDAGNLSTRYVIHAVGPIWMGFNAHEAARLLESAYRSSLELASANHIRTIAFPSLSTGAYRYPLQQAAPIALETVIAYLEAHSEIKLVRFVFIETRVFEAYTHALKNLLSKHQSISLPLF
ncbi:MAG: O-acetyl-ADP-ribose deacetylase [Chloroflexaceae bacterium]|nr:O-acetyl-ADP-ribose deacetylase [Chloroflexaceae bacterium]NJL33379.1 O-acetyl-ADP-ribose deacetylase [Chloroflexaceae bacterium]NJO06020.1 O-acetyl-ADP-ribose deacetylase [Chloroflexaceae bacterium]